MRPSRMPRLWSILFLAVLCATGVAVKRSTAVEIPLDSLTPVRIGYVDLQKIFDQFPEKSFAEGDLLKEIEKRRRELVRRQTEINTLRQQIAADQSVRDQARAGQAVVVPVNSVPEPQVAAPAPVVSTSSVSGSSSTVRGSTTAVVEPYPTDDPLAGLPGHDIPSSPAAAQGDLPGVNGGHTPSMLDLLASSTGPVLLNPQATTALETRINANQRALDRAIAQFHNFRLNAVEDMKVLQTEKTYGVMSKIYAVLENLARDEGITVVLDKSYILFGEDAVDLSDKLAARLQAAEGPQ